METEIVKVNIFNPHNAQKAFLKKMKEYPDVMNWVLKCSRQSGKSYLMLGLCLKECINNPNSAVLYISPTYMLARTLYKLTLKPRLKGMPFIQSTNDSELLVLFKNGSYIKFVSGNEYDSLRGYTLSMCVIDEASYCKKELFDVVHPFLQVKGKYLFIVSTPKMKGHFYDFYNYGLDPDKKDWQSFSWTYRDNNLLTPEQIQRIEDKKEVMTFQLYQQEYEGEFTDGNPELWDYKDLIENVEYSYDEKISFGVDIGMKIDRTVIVGFNKNGNMVYLKRLEIAQQRTISDIVEIITKILTPFKNFTCVIETNFQRGVYEQLCKKFNRAKIKEIVTTSKTKQEVVEDLILAFQNNSITILNDSQLHIELDAFQPHQKELSGYVRYGAINGYNDDCVMATCFALYCRKKYSNKVYNVGYSN